VHLRRLLLALVVALGGCVALGSPQLGGAPVSAAPLPEAVRADVLPAPQIGGTAPGGGVVWKQTITGNTVYAGGEFTTARPFGIAPGGAGEIGVNNLIAYDLSTGDLDTSFHPDFNGPILDMAVTPDGTKLVVVGNFTQVDGVERDRVAAFNLNQAGRPLSTTIAPSVNGQVNAVAATNSTIWFGGLFNKVGTTARLDVASVTTAGALTPLSIKGINGRVRALVVKPDGTQIAFGGAFTSVAGSSNPGYGMYRANAVTGAQLPLPVNSVVRDGGANAAILGMGADSTSFYGAGYDFNAGSSGNSEGVFQASWANGSLVTLEDCHGDAYGVAPVGGVVYEATHHHNCTNSGGFPQKQPQPWISWHSTAWTKAPAGTNIADTYGYPSHPGTPHGALLPFFPQYQTGTYTGQNQATFTVTGNADYVLYGGEFPSVDGIAQQGIVRFGTRANSPSHVGPSTQAHVGPTGQDGGTFVAHVQSFTPGEVRVSWPALWDRDDLSLTYDVYRNGDTTPVNEQTAANFQWTGTQLTFKDTGLNPGDTASYVVKAKDADGNTLSSNTVSTTVASTSQLDDYAAAVIGDGPSKFWRLDGSGSTVTDLAGPDYTTAGSGVTQGAEGQAGPTGDTAATLDGSDDSAVVSSNLTQAPDTFSEEVWFKTTSTSGGRIAGFGDAQPGSKSDHYDRILYLDSSGILRFGVAPGGTRFAVRDAKPVNDGQWHQAVATLGAHGMFLFVDGIRVGAWSAHTTGETYGGYWRLGADSTWAGGNLTGSVDDFSVYPTALTDAQVRAHYLATGRTAGPDPTAPRASFGATSRGRRVTFRGAGTSSDASIQSYGWSFGDGTRAAAQNVVHTYARAGTYTAVLTVTDDRGYTATSTRRIKVVNARPYATFVTRVHKKTVSLYASRSSDVDGRIVSYVWSFGDGKTGHGVSVRHKYRKAKKYTVRLTVTDNSGAKTSVTRQVKAKKH
jgi:PKD repeat protein